VCGRTHWHKDFLLHKTQLDEALEPVESAGAVPASTDPIPQAPQKKRRRRRSRRRRKAGASAQNGAVPNGASTEANGPAGPVVAAAPAAAAAPADALAQPQPTSSSPAHPSVTSRTKRAQGRRRRQRADLGSWRAEPPGERGRWRPGQAQAHSPSLWMAWNAFRFGKGNADPES